MRNLSRRGFLSGLLSSAAIVAAGPVAKIVPPLPDRFEAYTSHFKLQKEIVAREWKSVARVLCIDPGNVLDAGLPPYHWQPEPPVVAIGRFPRNSNAGMVIEEIA